MSPVDNLLHLAVHSYRDMFMINHNILDANELINQKSIDYTELLDISSNWKSNGALHYLLVITK